MERIVSATEARVHFGELLRQVSEEGQTIIVERDGRPQAVVISVAEYERMLGQETPNWQTALERLRLIGERILERRQGLPLPPPEEWIREAREERDEQLANLY